MPLLPDKTIFTVGHSTRAIEGLLELLQDYQIELLVDVRTVPKSRRMPHFSAEALSLELPRHGIAYSHERSLGGWRRPVPGSPNSGWRSSGFQGYADHMATPEFELALTRLTEAAAARRAAIMCAEALYWRCHRMLVSDALAVRGWRVVHIGAGACPAEHSLTPFAVVDGERITYPPSQGRLPLEGGPSGPRDVDHGQ